MKNSATSAFKCLLGKRKGFFRLLFFTSALFIFGEARAQTTFYVNDASTAGDKFCTAPGNNANSGLSAGSPKFTINDAMALAASGDRILVDNGEYLITSLVVSNGVKLVGADPDNTILRVQATGAPIQLASNSEIWNCKIFRAIPGTSGNPPTISLANQAGASNVRIENCFFYKNRTAIYLNWGNNITIARNRFDDNRTAIIVDVLGGTNYNDLVIRDNEIKNSRSYGIIMFGPLEGSHTGYVKATVENNIITGNLAGGIEYNNTNASSQVTLRSNWFGVAPGSVDVKNMRTNGGFNVADHDGTGLNTPSFTDNGTLIGASYPNDLSGGNVAALTVLSHASSAPMGAGPTLFVKSSNPAFDYFTNVMDAVNGSNANATITIPDGTFREDVNINKALRVTGNTQAGTILKGLYYTTNANAVELSANGASLNNLTVTRDFGTTLSEWNNSLKNQGLVINANNDTVNNVLITGNRNGLYINNRQGFVVTNNNIEQNRTGIQMGNDISNGRITNNKINNNFTHGVMLNAGLGPVNATGLTIKNNEIKDNWYTQIYLQGAGTITSNNTSITCNSYGTNLPTTNNTAAGEPGYTAQTPSQFGGTAPAPFATFAGTQIAATPTAPWLDNAVDAQPAASGFQRATSITVVPVAGPLSAVNNDYRILANAIGCVESGNTVTMNGTFNWNTTEAKAAWALGTNGVLEGSTAAAATGSGDDYSITPADFADNVILTSATMGGGIIQGPSDLNNVALESAIYFNSNKATSSFKNWTISKLKFKDLDVAVIADHNGGPLNVMDGLTITNNEFTVPADLNTAVAPLDNFQNIAIHLNYGKNQNIANNKFILDGTGVSDSVGGKYSISVALQSATGGGNEYDNLKIQNNEVHVTGVPNADPARVVGFWENSNNQNSAIDISGNTFVNDAAGNLAANNKQLAFRITSFSGDATHQVVYQKNEVAGFNRAFDFLGDPFSQYTANAYYATANPVVIKNNKVQNTKFGVTVRKDPASANTGSPALVNNNSFKGIPAGGYAIANLGTGANTDATCNYLDSPMVQPAANVTFLPRLNSGIDVTPAVTGFDPAPNTCVLPVWNITQNTTYATIQSAVNAANANDIIQVGVGTYKERVTVDKPLTLQGDTLYTQGSIVMDGSGLTGTGSGITLNNGIQNVTVKNLTIKNYAGLNPNASAGIKGVSNNNLKIRKVDIQDNTGGAGIYLGGPINNVWIDSAKVTNHSNVNGASRGIVIWDQLKTNIKIENSIVSNNNCCGIELQDGTASGVIIRNNTISGVDNAIGLVGLQAGSGANIIEGNNITITNGRFGIEIKNPNGTGNDNDTEDGAIIVRNNTVTLASTSDARDLAGIAVMRRGWQPGNANVPTGVVVKGNTVTGFVQPSTSTGFGIVMEGINHKVLNNIVNGNDVGIQRQSGNLPYAANASTDGDQSNLADAYFGRGNSPVSCSIEVTGNTPNTVTDVMYSGNRVVKNINSGLQFCSISDAVADAGTVNTHVLEARGTDAFNETVNVNKELTIRGAGATRPVINFTGTLAPGSKPALFTVAAANVTIDSFEMRVDFAKIVNAILTNGNAANLHVNKNKIQAYRSATAYAAGFTAYGLRNAININPASSNSPGATQVTSGFDGVVIKSNEITGTAAGPDPAAWRSGVNNDLCGIIVGGNTAAEGNTISSINHDVVVRFQNQGVTTIKNNIFNGGGVQYSEPNAGGGNVTIEQNTFNYQLGALTSALVRLQNNVSNKVVSVKNNTFSGHDWYISMENFKNVSIDGNTFTPSASATAFRHITVNTKLLASTALSSIVRQTIDATIINNIFNGSATATNGKGIAFYNHWNDGGAQLGNFIVGQAGAKNTFNDGITNYIFIDSLNNISTTTLAANYPEYPGAGAAASTTGYWTKDINGINNLYAASVAGTPKLFTAMNFSERYNYLYGHIYDKADNVNIARVIFATPVHNITHPSDYASIQEAIDAAVTLDGDIIVADSGLYREHLNINKNNLTIRGANAGISGNNGGRTSESILSALSTSLTQSLINLPAARTVTFDGFTVANAEQIMANTSGSNTLTLKNNIIRDITSTQNTSGHNFYWQSGSLTLDSNKVVFSGLNTDNNGGKSHFFIAGGSISAKGNTFSSSALVTPSGVTTSRPVLFNLTSNLSQASIYNNVFDDFGLGMLIAGQASNLDIYNNDFRNAVELASPTSGASIAFYEGFAPTGLINIHNNNFENSSIGIRTSGSAATTFPGSNLLRIRNNKFSGMTNSAFRIGASFSGNLDALCNSFGTVAPFAPDLTATGNAINVLGTASVNYRNWLVYGDNNVAALGFQTQTQYTVASTGNTSANNNDYRLLSNAVGCAVKGDVVTMNGAFTWNNANSQQEWEKGNDGKLATTDDNWSIVMPLDVDSVTLTGINNATLNGPGDLAAANLESFLAANNGHNAKWNINNLTIKDIDLAIAFQSTATGAADSLQLHHNTIYIPKDLNAQVAPADVNQNIGIILANGKGQRVNNNTVYVDGSGVSNGFAQKSTSVVLQSTTTGSNMYDGLKINDNTIHVTGLPNADTSKTAYVLGIWENGHNKNADIQIYNNKFLNDNAGNLSANNKQLAFRVTSRSGAAKLVTYNHNEITGFNRGIEWIGDPFSTFGPYSFEADAMPVEVKNNKISNVQYGVSVRKDNASPNLNAPAYVNNNSFTGIGKRAIVYTATTGTVDASCNYYDTADIAQVIEGNVNFGLYLNSGTNIAAIGFEPAVTTACIGRVHNVTQNTWYPTIQSAIDHPTTVDNDVIVAEAGTYPENVMVTKSLDIRGNNYGINPNISTRIAESVIVPATSDIQNGVVVSVEKKKVSISGFTIDGDNTKLTSTFAGVSGADLDAAEAIAVYTNNIDSLTVKHNIIRNTSYQGITLYGASASAPATTGHLIDANLIKNLGTYSAASGIANWGGGVLLYNSHYARVINNVMDNVRVGVQTGNYHTANPGSVIYQTITTNTIHARRRGIFHNLHTVNSSPYTISFNNIDAVANANETAVWDGILSASLSVPSFLTSNTINGLAAAVPSRGIQVWNVKSTTPVTVSGGQVSNVDIGVYANNYDGYNSDAPDGASISLASITIAPKATGTGMRIADNTASATHANVSVLVNSGVVISGGAKGVLVEHANATATLNTLALTGQTGNYIELSDNANNIDATAVTFEGQTAAAVSLLTNFNTEDKIVHKIDEGVLGFVKVKNLSTFVTPLSFTANTLTAKLQRGVDAASSGWTEHVKAGAYTDNVNVNKSMIILGAGSATTKVNSVTTNGNTITITADNVTIKDLHVEGVPVSGSSATRGIYVNGIISGLRLENIKSSLHQHAVFVDNQADINGLTVINSELSNSGNGLQVEAQAKVTKLYMTGGSVNNNLYGLYSSANSSSTSNQSGLNKVSITGVTFSGNQVKGMYFEKLDSAAISGNILTGNGTTTASPSGMDINLKYGSYSNIVVTENKLTSNGATAAAGTGINVKARNDSPYNINTASLNNLFINSNEVAGSPVGIAVGNNIQGASVHFENNLVSGASRGVVIYGMSTGSITTLYHNSITASPTTIENGNGANSQVMANCNWLGSTVAATIASSIIGDVAYNPWLLNGTDASANTGFQTTAPCNTRPTSVITVSGDDTICYGSSTALSIALTGNAPWTVTYTDGTTPVTQSGVMTSPLILNVTPLGTTTYTVTALNDTDYPALATDMTGSATVQVTVAPIPSISYTSPFCKLSTGEQVTLTGTGTYLGGTFSSTAGLSINPVTGAINPSASTAGNYTVAYTTLAIGGCSPVTGTTSVTVRAAWTASISGTTTVAQNINTTANISFVATGAGGKAPYTFHYSVQNGANTTLGTVSTTGTGTVVTVPQSNAVAGQYIYTLISATDSAGCAALLPGDLKDTITVTAGSGTVDLTPVIVVTNPSFTNAVTTRPYELSIFNLGNAPSAGAIGIYVIKPNSGSTLTFDPSWTVSESPGYYYLESSSHIINGNFGSITINGTITVSAGVAPSNFSLQVILGPGTGGDSVPGNNGKSINLNKTN